VIFDESALQAHIEGLLGGRVRQLTVRSTDLVRDMMVVDVRYSVPTRSSSSNAVRPAQSNHTLEGAF
jgi:hypothetical protein